MNGTNCQMIVLMRFHPADSIFIASSVNMFKNRIDRYLNV